MDKVARPSLGLYNVAQFPAWRPHCAEAVSVSQLYGSLDGESAGRSVGRLETYRSSLRE
jgi:hypothetical protein